MKNKGQQNLHHLWIQVAGTAHLESHLWFRRLGHAEKVHQLRIVEFGVQSNLQMMKLVFQSAKKPRMIPFFFSFSYLGSCLLVSSPERVEILVLPLPVCLELFYNRSHRNFRQMIQQQINRARSIKLEQQQNLKRIENCHKSKRENRTKKTLSRMLEKSLYFSMS